VESSLGEFLEKPKGSALYQIPMLVSDEELANKITTERLEKLKKAGDRLAYLKEKMYYPLVVDDIFLNEDTNIFDIESAKRQKNKLLQQERTGVPVILVHDGEKVIHEFTDKLPISNFPLTNSDNKDAPVVIYEFPISDPPYGLYVAGVDPYRQGQAAYSTSLGSVYIYKRCNFR
jgi:type IV secretory pathway VirB9-like protein